MSSDELTRKKPGRKAESAAAKAMRLHKEWKEAEKLAAEIRERKLVKIGEAIIAEAKTRADFLPVIREILVRNVTSKAALTQLLTLLDEEV